MFLKSFTRVVLAFSIGRYFLFWGLKLYDFWCQLTLFTLLLIFSILVDLIWISLTLLPSVFIFVVLVVSAFIFNVISFLFLNYSIITLKFLFSLLS